MPLEGLALGEQSSACKSGSGGGACGGSNKLFWFPTIVIHSHWLGGLPTNTTAIALLRPTK